MRAKKNNPLLRVQCQRCPTEFYILFESAHVWGYTGPVSEYVCCICELEQAHLDDMELEPYEEVGFGD